MTEQTEPTMQVPVSLPTREQIAEAIAKAEDADYWIDEARQWEAQEQWERDAHPEEYPGMAYEDRESFLRTADAVLALLSQPTPTTEPGRTLTEAQTRAVSAAVEGLAIHAEACGHRRVDRECPYCDDKATVKAARAALGRAVWGPGEADPADPRWRPPVQPAAEPPSIADMAPGTTFTASLPTETWRWAVRADGLVVSAAGVWQLSSIDPSTIRDVTPPAVTE